MHMILNQFMLVLSLQMRVLQRTQSLLKMKDQSFNGFQHDIIVLSSDNEDINEGLSKRKMPKEDINEGLSKRNLPPLGSSARPRPEVSLELAKLSSMGHHQICFVGSTDEETSDTESTDKNITIGTTGKRPPGSYADKEKGKPKFEIDVGVLMTCFCIC
nr:hypothetical protein [Tanacetum cinerariifolium]